MNKYAAIVIVSGLDLQYCVDSGQTYTIYTERFVMILINKNW